MRGLFLIVLGLLGIFFARAQEPQAPSSVTEVDRQNAPAPQTGTPVAILEISGKLYAPQVRQYQEKLERAQERGAEVLIVDLASNDGGDYDETVKLIQAIKAFPGRKAVWFTSEATGVHAALAIAFEEVYCRPNAVLGDLSASGEEGSIPLSDYARARIRAELPEVPFRAELARAMMDPEEELIIADETVKTSDQWLVLTGKEAAQRFATEDDAEAPLLIQQTFTEREALLGELAGEAGYRLVPLTEALPETQPIEEAGEIAMVEEAADEGPHSVYVVEISGVIDSPQLFILRRALKEAIANDIDTLVLDMNTPGGALGTTLEMMEALQKFKGRTITYVNPDAISAGSYIAIATDDIYFSPSGAMGAAEAVTGTGEDIPESMNRKITSYMEAKIRAVAGKYRYRADVQRAMMDPDFELIIEGEVISPAGELLTLTADEAVKQYGDPPQNLLAAGIADSVDELLDDKYGAGNYTVKAFNLTWSEEFAKWFKMISPMLLGLGILLIYFEAQTPGFGVFGIAGLVMLALFFSANHIAGLAGYEEVLIFLIGLILIGVELFLFPGTFVFAISGALMMIGALIWAMVDVWPGDAFELDSDMFVQPVANLGIGILLAIIGALLFARFLPRRLFWDRIILKAQAAMAPGSVTTGIGDSTPDGAQNYPLPGATGQTVSGLRPSGEVEIDGRRYQARARTGSLPRGASIRVTGRRDYFLIVEEV